MADLDLLGQLEASFDTKPVSIIEFAEGKRFCKRTLYPRQRLLLKLFFLEDDFTEQEERVLEYWEKGGRNGTEVELGPGIRDRIADLKSRGFKNFREIVLVGGRRCSKGFVTGLSLAKKMYNTVQLQDPGRHYGIDVDKEIYFSCVAASLDQAKGTQYADFSSMVNSCQAMQQYIYKVQHLEFSVMTDSDVRKVESWKRQKRRIERDISKLRGNALPANARTIRGNAMMALVFDEFAHFQQGESDQSDVEVYAAAKPSLDQFGRDAMLFVNSSPYSKTGKFYERYEAGMATNNGSPESPEVLALRFPSWALFEGWWEDPTWIGPKKCITVSPDWDPDHKTEDGEFFYTDDDRAAITQQRQEEAADGVKFKVERRGHFAEVIDAYLIPEMVDRMFAGRPIDYDEERREWRYQPYKPNWDFSTYQFKYYAHLDPSSTTAGFGFALGHVELMEIAGASQPEHHLVFDIIKRWNPKDFPDNTIDWDPILEEVVALCDLFRPVQLGFDQFNSDYPITWLRRQFMKRRIETRVFQKKPNAESNWNRAEIFRTALNRGFVHAPHTSFDDNLQYASEELKYLQEIKTSRISRVEKQDIGPIQTKDMADCCMEVVEATIGDLMSTQLREDLSTQPLRMGAQGGYPLGGPDRGGYGKPVGRSSPFSEIYTHKMAEARARRSAKVNPARRPPGGRPVSRRLPGW